MTVARFAPTTTTVSDHRRSAKGTQSGAVWQGRAEMVALIIAMVMVGSALALWGCCVAAGKCMTQDSKNRESKGSNDYEFC